MENVKINNQEYRYIVNFKEDELLRESFNRLASKTFGFDCEEWYQKGFWKEQYIPYALVDGEQIVASISVYLLDVLLFGEKRHCIQLSTVMTAENYRGQGLNRFIMERVLAEWQDKGDLIYLFANDSVLNYYPRFGFIPVVEYQHSKKMNTIKINGNQLAEKSRKLNISVKEDMDLLLTKVNKSIPLYRLSILDNISIVMFYCLSPMREKIYYLEEMEAVVIADYSEGKLFLYDIFSPQEISIDEIIAEIARPDTGEVVLGFTPLETASFELDVLQEENTTLFMLAEQADFFHDRQLRFPLLSHA